MRLGKIAGKLLFVTVICFGLIGSLWTQPIKTAYAAAPDAPKKILFIPSYSFEYPGIRWFNDGFMKELREKQPNKVSFSIENLQLATHRGDEAYFNIMAESLKVKYAQDKPDLIVAQYRQAYDFLHDYGRQIFGDVPVVFAGLELEGYGEIRVPPHFAGVFTTFNAKRSIDLILQLQPQVRTLYVINGLGKVEKETLANALAQAQIYENRLQIVVLSQLPYREILARVPQIKGDAAILYLSLQLDADGRAHVPAEVAREIGSVAQVPVYGMLDTAMGGGVTGGFLINHEKLGRRAADIAAQILQGRPPSELHVTYEPIAEYTFDWRQLKRRGIDEALLPAGSRVEFKEFSVWESYKVQIVSGILLILLLGGLVIGLLISRRRRILLEEELRDANENLEENVAVRTRELDGANESLAAQNEEVIAMNKEIDSLNQSLRGMNEILERRVLERTSDLSAAHQELVEAKAFLNAAMDQSQAGIAIADAGTGQLRYVNDAGLMIRGGRREEIVNGVGVDQYVNSWRIEDLDGRPLQREEVPLARAILFNEKASREMVVRNANDEARIVLTSAAPIKDPEGKIIAGMVVFLDITEQKRAEAKIKRNAQIQEILREIAEAAVLLKTPEELYVKVYQSIARILPAQYFLVNLLDEATGEIVVPFHSTAVNFVPQRRPVGNGMTEYIMRLGRAVLLTPADMDRLRKTGEYKLEQEQKVHVQEYLGAPLIDSTGKSFGMISAVLLDESQTFQVDDVEVLSVIASQVSMAIERRQKAESLQKSEKKYRTIIETTSDGFWITDGDGRILETNETCCTLLGYSRKELRGMGVKEINPEEAQNETKERIARIRKYGSEIFETQLVRKDGVRFPVEVSAMILPDGDGQMTVFCRDISERKHAEEALLESESRYRVVLEQAPEAIMLWNLDTRDIVEVNSRFTERLGYNLADGKLNLFDLIVDDRENIESNIRELEQKRYLPLQRRRFKHRNGSLSHIERSCTLINYQGRRLAVTSLRDVSDEVRREQEIRRDAELAVRVQNALLSVPEASEYLEISTVYKPFGYVGGDLYFLDWRYGGKMLRGFLVDATGHGLSTALHTASLHVLLREVNEHDLPLSEAMRWLNLRAGQYFDEGTFAGTIGFELDLQPRQLRWTCAGIPKIWVSTKTEQGVRECPGMSLGINEEETFETHTMAIDIGDTFYFMTDGLSDLMLGQPQLPLEKFSETVGLLKKLSEAENCRDDATAVCIHVRAMPHSIVREDGWPRIIRFSGYGDYQRFKGEVGKILAEVTGKPHSLQEVAVHEALANALECRDGVPRQHKARLRFNKVGNRLIVRVKTSRIGFAGNAILRRLRSHPEDMFSFGEDAAMGRGIPMMLSMSHKMTYNNDGTEVLLAWKLL